MALLTDFDLPPIGGVASDADDHLRDIIEKSCRRPELHALSTEVYFTVDGELDVPFRVSGGNAVCLSPQILAKPSVAALCIRHALELAMWKRLGADGESAVGLLACRAAGIYLRMMNAEEHDICRSHIPKWLLESYEALASDGPVGPHMIPLSRLDDEPNSGDCCEKTYRRLCELAAPVEFLLTTGGDTRLHLDPECGLNALGCSPRPRPWAITFATSTATSISQRSYLEAEKMRASLVGAALVEDIGRFCKNETESLKTQLLAVCGAETLSGTEIIFAPSGTDGEFFALYLAHRLQDEEIVNIIVAPDETGSGVMNAVSGRHFATQTALGVEVEIGSPLEGLSTDRIRVEEIAVRDETGELRPILEIDREVELLVDETVSQGHQCLLHLLDSSKTGSGAPSIEAVKRLRGRHGSRFDVVVDACQMRVARENLRGYLECGFMILVTGSKFYTGPAFSGALIVPETVASRVNEMAPLPTGFNFYSTCNEWPVTWDAVCKGLPKNPNLGLLLRWKVAIWEMCVFDSVPLKEQCDIMREFACAVEREISAFDALTLVNTPVLDRNSLSTTSSWDRLPSIFSFAIRYTRPNGNLAFLDITQLRKVYHWLNKDISDWLPGGLCAEDHRIAAKCCHIGQPVKLGQGDDRRIAALRLSCGGRLVSRVAFDTGLGATVAERLDHQIKDARKVFQKITLIAKHFNCLCKTEGQIVIHT